MEAELEPLDQQGAKTFPHLLDDHTALFVRNIAEVDRSWRSLGLGENVVSCGSDPTRPARDLKIADIVGEADERLYGVISNLQAATGNTFHARAARCGLIVATSNANPPGGDWAFAIPTASSTPVHVNMEA